MRPGARCALMAVTSLTLAAPAPAADLSIGAGSSLDLGTGHLDLGCADLTVVGRLAAGSVGVGGVGDLAISPGGEINGNSATLTVAGSWNNAGTFDADTSTVQLVDGCTQSPALISGNSIFATLKLTTTVGKQ